MQAVIRNKSIMIFRKKIQNQRENDLRYNKKKKIVHLGKVGHVGFSRSRHCQNLFLSSADAKFPMLSRL